MEKWGALINWKSDEVFLSLAKSFEIFLGQGYVQPPIRTFFYYLTENDEQNYGWDKKNRSQYGKLCSQLDKWKREGKEVEGYSFRYGQFSDSSGGADYMPYTQEQIDEQLEAWQNEVPLVLSTDGNLYCVFIEHGGLVQTFRKHWGGKIAVLSSEGQIRHEHLYARLNHLIESLEQLKGEKIIIYGIADYDIYGAKGEDEGRGYILKAHKEWIEQMFPTQCEWRSYGINSEQILKAGLNPEDEHQFEGWVESYGLRRFVSEIRKLCKLGRK